MTKHIHYAPSAFYSLLVGFALALVFSLPVNGAEAEKLDFDQVTLRQDVVVSEQTVHLGDFFEGVGEKANIAIAYAPAPGKRAIFDANWLYRVAHAYGLKWKPLSMKQQTVVRRDSVPIERAEIEDNIFAALLDQGADPDLSISLSNRTVRLFAASSADASVIVDNATYDPRSKRFSAFISTPGSQAIRVTGRLQRRLNVPVLNRRVSRDEMIRAEDISWIESPSERVQHDIVMYEDDLVGKTPKRGLRAGTPVRSGDVRRPILVKKGSIVTMILKTPMMTLTSQGRSSDDGSDGDVIRITNTQSNKVVQAVVTGTGMVAITPASHIAMN